MLILAVDGASVLLTAEKHLIFSHNLLGRVQEQFRARVIYILEMEKNDCISVVK